MALVPIETLLAKMTQDQVRTTLVDLLVGLGIPADKWRTGGTASTILTVVAATFADFQSLVVDGIGSGFLETAEGGWLVLLAYYVYGVTAPPATFASGNLTLTNAGGGTYSYSAGGATFLNPTNGISYVNTASFTLNPSASLTIPIQATRQGSAGSSAPSTITQLVTTMLSVTCSNGSSVVGQDAATDAEVRTLCQDRLGVLSVRGPRTAYLYAAKTATNTVTGLIVNINRVSVTPSSSKGTVTVYLASPSGIPDPDDVTGVATNIELIARPDCVTVTVLPCTTVAYSPSIVVWVKAGTGTTSAALQTAIADAITAYIAAYPIGGLTTDAGQGLFASGIDGVAGPAVAGMNSTIVSVEGSTDLALVDGQVATDGVTVSVRLTT